MADVGQALATGGTTIVGVAVGAGLTYWFGALNRRHQEAREDKTRWYEERLRAYVDYYHADVELYVSTVNKQTTRAFRRELVRKLFGFLSVIDLVGSPEVIEAAARMYDAATEEMVKEKPFESGALGLDAFIDACRKDLGHPLPPGGKHAATKPRPTGARQSATKR